MMSKKFILLLSLLLCCASSYAQKQKPYDFGEPIRTRDVPRAKLRLGGWTQSDTVNVYMSEAELIAGSGDSISVSSGPFFNIPIQESTSPSGGLVYNIPVPTAAGVKGAPAISLAYNSQGGNGLAGYGWNIGGLSSISISNKNHYYNGVVAPANIADTTSFYTLDGDPIVLNADLAQFPGYRYETARGHIKIRKRVTNGIVTHFYALYPDGSRAVFGDSLATSARGSFPIVQLKDKEGYVTRYSYMRPAEANISFVTQISYGAQGETASPARISFEWDARDDATVQYSAAERVCSAMLLKGILSFDGDSVIADYTLTHTLSDRVNLLTRLDFAKSGEQANPLLFQYGPQDPTGSNATGWNTVNTAVSTNFNVGADNFMFFRGKFVPGTFNDGVAIIPARPYFTQRSNTLFGHYYSSGYINNESVMVLPSVNDLSNAVVLVTAVNAININAVDVDGDSVDEIVIIRESNPHPTTTPKTFTIQIYKYAASTGTFTQSSCSITLNGFFHHGTLMNHYSANQRDFLYGDFVGDGGMQAVALSYSTNVAGYSQTPYAAVIDLKNKTKLSDEVLFSSYTEADVFNVFALDIDSDGRTELCRATASGLETYHLTSQGTFTLDKTISGLTSSNISASGRQPSFTDLNGDGYIDVAVSPAVNGFTWDIYTYTGDCFLHSTDSIAVRSTADKYVFVDVTGDGLPECNVVSGNSIRSYLNDCGTISSLQLDSLVTAANTDAVPVNILSYNAASSFYTVEDSHITTYTPRVQSQQTRALTGMTDSFGRVTRNSYAMMSDTDIYRSDSLQLCNNAAGFADIAAPLLLLRSSNSYASGSMIPLKSRYYEYSCAVAHQFGLGFCGFRQILCKDYVSPGHFGVGIDCNRPLISVQAFDPEKMGIPTESWSRIGYSGGRMIHTTNVWDNHSTTYGKLDPRLTATTQVDSLSGITTVSTFAYDGRGYPVLTETVRTNEFGDVKRDSVTVTYSHQYSSERYILGTVLDRRNTLKWKIADTTTTWTKRHTYTADSLGRITSSQDRAWLHERVYFNPEFPHILDPLSIGGGTAGSMSHPGGDGTMVHPIDDPPISLYITETEGGGIAADEHYHYDAFGNIDTLKVYSHGATTPLVTTYSYDSAGRYLLSSTNPMGFTMSYSSYNLFGKPASVTDHRGRTTTQTFDAWGNVVRTDYEDGTWESQTMAWDSLGLYRVNTLNSAGQQGVTHYDAAGRPVRSGSVHFDGRWIVSDKQYDPSSGLLSRESIPHPSDAPDSAILWSSISYDRYGRDTCITDASGRIATKSYNASVTSSTVDGITTTVTVDANGNTILVHDPGGDITTELRPDGKPKKTTVHGGVVTTFAYDAYGIRYKIVDPAIGTQTDTTVWNADGSSSTTTTRGLLESTTVNADRFGRETQRRMRVLLLSETILTSSYDAYGRLSSRVSNEGPSVTYTYDAYDRPLTIVENSAGNNTFTKAYTYNADGTTASVAYSSSFAGGLLATENYTYSNGVLCQTSLSDGTIVSRIDSENDLGQISAATTPHGIQRQYGYTSAGLPLSRSIGTAAETYTFSIPTGNLSSRTFAQDGQGSPETFSYDGLGRLSSSLLPGASVPSAVAYDSKNNVTSIGGAATMQYTTSGKPYMLSSYTASDSGFQRNLRITYNAAEQPESINGNQDSEILYGASGFRSRMKAGPTRSPLFTRYYFDGGRLDVDVTSSGAKTIRLYLGGNPYSAPAVLVSDGMGTSTVYNIWRDHLGSIRAIGTDSTHVSYFSYDSWGRPRDPDTLAPLPYDTAINILNRGFTGHEYLPWAGVYNANARLYDPLLGRFLSADPYIQNPSCSQNYNRFAYCLNNPLKYTDEDGECFLTTLAIVSAACALVFGAGDAAAHALRHDRGWFKYFFQGALAGAIVGAAVTSVFYGAFALGGTLAAKGGVAAILGNTINGIAASAAYASAALGGVDALTATVGLVGGFVNNGGKGVGNQLKLLLGRYYMDENDFFGGVLQGVSRFTWERYQTSLGYEYSSIRNAFGSSTDRVDYLGGATFVTNENSKHNQGITIGSYCNMDISDSIDEDFDFYVMTHPLYMHEYGHIIDSRSKGPSYLFSVGTRSLLSARSATPVNSYTTTHDYKSYEKRANRNAKTYFGRYYGVSWSYSYTSYDSNDNPIKGTLYQWLPL
ncbi:MAG: VCBS repeat-containing protein [Bacteroidales bacterium]|nr:VCBS repeat-containing protein [Bacteroidales bacterium]